MFSLCWSDGCRQYQAVAADEHSVYALHRALTCVKLSTFHVYDCATGMELDIEKGLRVKETP